MRPVRRGGSPRPDDFDTYQEAKPELISRLGSYCSYCERRIPTMLAVEHIQPKGLSAYAHLAGRWDNFLLGCVNCNSTKGDKDVVLKDVLLSDRDNTHWAFTYLPDGRVIPSAAADERGVAKQAANTLALTGLDKRSNEVVDENGKRVAIDRVSQRLEKWLLAEEAKSMLDADPDNNPLRISIVHQAQESGFFSIWMTVFEDDVDMRNRLIDAFPGTRESGCFDPAAVLPVSPAPNPDGLADGGKI